MSIKTTITGPFVSVEALDELSLRDIPELLQAFDTASRNGPFVVLTDTTKMKSAPRAVLSAFAEGLKKKDTLTKAWLGDAVVVNSPAVRFMLSTLLVVAPMPTEVKVFDKRPLAERWCADLLRKAGINPPQPLRAASA